MSSAFIRMFWRIARDEIPDCLRIVSSLGRCNRPFGHLNLCCQRIEILLLLPDDVSAFRKSRDCVRRGQQTVGSLRAIAQAWHKAGARLAFTYQGERLKENVEESGRHVRI